MTFFNVLSKAEQLLFELGWRAGYNARRLDEKRSFRRIYPFETTVELSYNQQLDGLLSAQVELTQALRTVLSLAVQYDAAASERYAREELAKLENKANELRALLAE
jgi:hypothetical protein